MVWVFYKTDNKESGGGGFIHIPVLDFIDKITNLFREEYVVGFNIFDPVFTTVRRDDWQEAINKG